jgi:hypothetical protein
MAEEFSARLRQSYQALQAHIEAILHNRESNLAIAMEKNVLRMLSRFQKKYRGFNRDMQRYLQETFTEFARICHKWMVELSLVN